jgi:hypothetical protein
MKPAVPEEGPEEKSMQQMVVTELSTKDLRAAITPELILMVPAVAAALERLG